MSRAKSRILGVATAVMLAASPLALISVSAVTGCGGSSCLPNIPCGCSLRFSAGLLAIWLLRNGEDVAGRSGISCWDLNADSLCDLATEDANTDGVCDVLDCQGEPGQDVPGIDGINCWDLNANGVGDPDEDLNADGAFDAFDCQGSDGPPGSDGSNGPPGPPGSSLYDLFIEDFFTIGAISQSISGQGEVIQIEEPILQGPDIVLGPRPIAFRVSVPEVYKPGDPVTLRIFLWREVETTFGCTTVRLDIFRMFPGSGIARYGAPVWLRLEPGTMTNPGMMVVDLPLNTPAPGGLGFSNDLFAPQMLAFEMSVFAVPGTSVGPVDLDGIYTVLGGEMFESASAADTAVSGVTVFTSDAGVLSFCEPPIAQ